MDCLRPAILQRVILRQATLGVLLGVATVSLCSTSLHAQSVTPPAPVATRGVIGVTPELRGRPVESVSIVGNRRIPTSEILNMVRTHEGEAFDPETVAEDYQRIFSLRKFSNVLAQIEPTPTGVRVVFQVTEERQVQEVRIVGNLLESTNDILNVIDVHPGEAMDPFRINGARLAIETFYRSKGYPYAHVEVPQESLRGEGNLVFKIVEGPPVLIRQIQFIGNKSVSTDKLKGQTHTRAWFFIFNSGHLEPETLEDDVAAIRRYYHDKGFFDVRVDRKLIISPDQREVQVNFLIEEGPRYTIDHIIFRGNVAIPEVQLRQGLRISEGSTYDHDAIGRDVRQMIKDYSPLGFVYLDQSADPDYLRIEPRVVYGDTPGKLDLVYDIHEGKAFKLGRIIVKGNTRTQDKVVLRELRVIPGALYNSGELQTAAERLRNSPYFENATITPIGNDPDYRDVVVEVAERRTISFNLGGGISSSGGVGASVSYEQKNFDIADPPHSWGDLKPSQSMVGAGQDFRISFEPGTDATNFSILFSEPWLFDQPYSLTTEAYFRNRIREDWDETRAGGRVTVSKRFGYNWSTGLTVRGEDVNIHHIDNVADRAPEILSERGHSTVNRVGMTVRRDTTVGGFVPYDGSVAAFTIDNVGLLGGEFDFNQYSASWDYYRTLGTDLLDRKTILSLRGEGSYIAGNAPFFERLYAGGLGSVRGFSFRGISPRSGPEDDRIGGNFSLTGTAEVSFPLAGESLRGVVFTDVGTVESDASIGTIRSSVGVGVQVFLPFLGQTPAQLNLAMPITKDDLDDTQLISFSIGYTH